MSREPEIVLPDGSVAGDADRGRTDRTIERDREDDRFTPVIIKRSDESRRHPDDSLEKAIAEGQEQCTRRTLSLVLSACAAGLIVGFSPMAVAVVITLTRDSDSLLQQRLLPALVYPLGFIVCLMSGAQLFTEHTATAVYPMLDRKVSVGSVLRLWALVIAGNLVGAALSGGLLVATEPVIQARAGYVDLGHHLVEHAFWPLLISALLAGWLMALGAWLVLCSPQVGPQIALVYVVTFLIGLGGLHHSIAGSVEMFAAMFMTEDITFVQAARFIGSALLGNLIGGSMFVALLNYAHIRRTQEQGKERRHVTNQS